MTKSTDIQVTTTPEVLPQLGRDKSGEFLGFRILSTVTSASMDKRTNMGHLTNFSHQRVLKTLSILKKRLQRSLKKHPTNNGFNFTQTFNPGKHQCRSVRCPELLRCPELRLRCYSVPQPTQSNPHLYPRGPHSVGAVG